MKASEKGPGSFIRKQNARMKKLSLAYSILRYSRKQRGENYIDAEGILNETLEKSLEQTSGEIQAYFHAKGIPLLLKQAKEEMTTGRMENACTSLESLLRRAPNHAQAHNLLNQIIRDTEKPKILTQAQHLQRTYGLKYAGAINLPDFAWLGGIMYTRRNSLLVSDYQKHAITHLTLEGKVLQKISHDLKYPGRFFQDNRENLWVCDTGNNRILLLDDDYTHITNEISMAELSEDRTAQVSPLSGCAIAGRFYVLLSDGTHHENRLISFRPETPRKTFQAIDLDERINIIDVKASGENLFLCTWKPNLILKYSLASNTISTLFLDATSYRFISIEPHGTELYISQSGSLCKINEKGKCIYHLDLPSITGKKVKMVNLSIGHKPANKRPSLFITDILNQCVHQFYINGF